MNQVAEWLKKIIATVILAGFLELLLPSNEFKNVTRMIIGLLIIMMMIQPLVKLIDLPQKVIWSLPNLNTQEVSPSTGDIIQQGAKLRQNWLGRFTEEHQSMIKQKISNIIGLIDEIQLQRVSLQTHGTELVKVVLKVKYTGGEFFGAEKRGGIENKIRNSVQLVTNLTKEHIEVVWSG